VKVYTDIATKPDFSHHNLIYYSIGCFLFISHDNWRLRDNFKKWVALEGILGWLILLLNILFLFQFLSHRQLLYPDNPANYRMALNYTILKPISNQIPTTWICRYFLITIIK
jgi:hypothetical protein